MSALSRAVRSSRAAFAAEGSGSSLVRPLARWVSGSSAAPGILEMRTYQLSAEGASTYMRLCSESARTRLEQNPGFLGLFTKETGGALNEIRHFYRFKDIGDRARVRGVMGKNPVWQEFLAASKPYLVSQHSMIFVPCDDVMAVRSQWPSYSHQYFVDPTAGSTLIRDLSPAIPSEDGPDSRGMYELRSYQLVPGYDTVPKLRKLFNDGLPSKISADGHGRLAAFAASDVGILNNVIELWRYGSPEASIKAREASRKAEKWRECIAGVAPLTQTFTTELLIPAPFSPWQ